MTNANGVKNFSLRFFGILAWVVLAVAAVPFLHAADEDFDSYKVRFSGAWFYSSPSGTLQGASDSGSIDIHKDLGLNTYSTFTGKVDWKFTRKNHLYFAATPFDQSRQTVLTRTITFQGQTFVAGLTANSEIKSLLFAPGYQYDIIRRKRGHLGLAVQLDLFDSSGSISAATQVTGGGVRQQSISAKASQLAPIPVAGPQYRLYLTNSPRVFLEGSLYGMYFFGYGNFISAGNNLGITLTKHLSVNAGYQLGSRLVVNNDSKTDRIGLTLTQKGPVVGAQLSF